MKTLYNIIAIILGTILFLMLFPLIFSVLQFGLIILFFLGQVLILPACVYMVYYAWNKATKKTENN
jgi:predicted ABC-type exoprotein transport system permease subunit